METRPDTTRTGAVWVAGTGAFLVLAAAALFVAVRWDQIPDSLKLAAVISMTGGFLHVGHRWRGALPGTSGTLWHLGALLVPVDVAALAIHGRADWGGTLLAEGMVCLPAFALLGRIRRSSVLDAAAGVAGVALAGGVGAMTPLPAPIVLAALAATAELSRQRREALGWALIAAFAPVITLVERTALPGGGVVERLGLAGTQPRLSAIATGVVAAVVIGRAAQRRHDVGLALIAVAAGLVGTITTVTGIDGTIRYRAVGAAAVVLAAELAAVLLDHDRFWKRPARLVAEVAEGVALLATPVVVALLAVAPFAADGLSPSLVDAGALGLLALAALIASERRGGHPVATIGCATAAVAAVVIGTADPRAVATALGLVALALAWSATRGSGTSPVPEALASLGAVGYGIAVLGGPPYALVAAVALGWVIAAVLDEVELGNVVRFGQAFVLAGVIGLDPREGVVVALAVGAVAVLDAVRRDDPRIGIVAALALPIAAGEGAMATHLDAAAAGVGLAVVATIVTFIALLVDDRWHTPFAVGVGLCWASGIALATNDKASFGSALLLLGGSGLAAGAALRRTDIAIGGSLAAMVGMWVHLAAASVHASEPYLLPACVLLLLLGVRNERTGASSWDTYAAPIAALGGAALVERLAGGGSGHALIAGAVGMAAVLGGGFRKLAAPLLLGTALLVAVTVHETLGLTAGVPTWAWLALGGSVLLAAGIAMERREVGPIETGRRLVDVLKESFA